MPRPPGWLVYPALLAAVLLTALGRRTHADSPPPPPQLPAPERAVLAETTPIDPAVLIRVRARRGPAAGTAFSVGDGGVWLTAASALAGCGRPSVLVNDVEGVSAHAAGGPRGLLMALTTAKGAAALPLADRAPPAGALGFAAGFPNGRPGEVAAQLIGARWLKRRGRGAAPAPVLVWAEMGRTEGLVGPLSGLAGAPILDGEGRVIGVVLAVAPRRGRIYAASPDEIAAALAAAEAPRPIQASGVAIDPDDYGLAADALRRALRVAPVACAGR